MTNSKQPTSQGKTGVDGATQSNQSETASPHTIKSISLVKGAYDEKSTVW